MMSADHAGLVALELPGRQVQIEYAWVGPADSALAPLIFLHEGLGSLAMWKDFPAQLCAATGRRGLVYSRPGYGGSTPRAADQHWAVDFMHREALQVLPALLTALDVTGPYVLFGHSDGGSIALIHAAQQTERVVATLVMAPHIVVEEFGLVSIRAAREQYLHGDLRTKLAKYHDDVDSAFWGWCDIWLSERFKLWRIVPLLVHLRGPVLAIQGEDDPYGTLYQIEGIASMAPTTQLEVIPACGHSPHREHPGRVLAASQKFLEHLRP